MGPPDTWDRLAAWLRSIEASLPEPPRALLVISAHWEEPELALVAKDRPGLLYDYYGFPKHTYELTWPAPGAPELAVRARGLLGQAGFSARLDTSRDWDHGVFVPLKVAFPEARIPTLQLSLKAGLDPSEHLAMGRALAPLRDEGVLVVGSGLSYHDLRSFGSARASADSAAFDAWLGDVTTQAATVRDPALSGWAKAPRARQAHPREEHLLPLLVAAGAAGADRGHVVFRDRVMNATISAIRFG